MCQVEDNHLKAVTSMAKFTATGSFLVTIAVILMFGTKNPEPECDTQEKTESIVESSKSEADEKKISLKSKKQPPQKIAKGERVYELTKVAMNDLMNELLKSGAPLIPREHFAVLSYGAVNHKLGMYGYEKTKSYNPGFISNYYQIYLKRVSVAQKEQKAKHQKASPSKEKVAGFELIEPPSFQGKSKTNGKEVSDNSVKPGNEFISEFTK
jgi:hypothetical protein